MQFGIGEPRVWLGKLGFRFPNWSIALEEIVRRLAGNSGRVDVVQQMPGGWGALRRGPKEGTYPASRHPGPVVQL